MVPQFGKLTLLAAAGGLIAASHGSPALHASPALMALEASQAGRERDLAAAQGRAEAAQLEIKQLEAELAELRDAQQHGDRSISDKRLKLAALGVQQTELDARMGADQVELGHLLGALELLRREPPPALFVRPNDVRAAVRAAILMRAITPELEQRAKALRDQALTLQAVRHQIDTASNDVRLGERAQWRRRAQIQAMLARQAAAQNEAAAAAQAAETDIVALENRAQALRDLTRGVVQAPGPIVSAEPPDPEHAGLFGQAASFAPPVAGAPARRFGEVDPLGRLRSEGWTWLTPDAATVVAPAEGVVEYAGPLKGWGLVLILRLGGDYHLVLAGLETIFPPPGRMVTRGQPVGRTGEEGPAGSELYFEIRKHGAPVDPARWLKAPHAGGGR